MNDLANPEMVTLAREARGHTQTQLAKLARISQAHLSKIEAGLVPVSPEVQTALARALRMPDNFFRQSERVFGPGTSELFHRKRQSVPASVLARIHAQLNILRIHVARLLRAVELPEARIPQLDLADFSGSPGEAARSVRAMLNVSPGPLPSVVCLIEDAGGLVLSCSFGAHPVDAISRWVPGLPPLFFANDSAPVDRFRLSLAHELGHMVLHRTPEMEMERQANEFAAELLMPAREIKTQLYGLTLARLLALKPYWRTSMAALLKRAEDLGCITPNAARYLWMQMSKRGYRKREPAESDLVPERPQLMNEIFAFYRNELGYTVDDLAKLLASTPEDLMNLYGLRLSKPETHRQLKVVR